MNISLTPELESMIRRKVTEGRYLSASEVIREALRLLEDHERLRQIRLDVLRRDIAIGVEELDRGESGPLDAQEIKAAGREKLARSQRKGR